MSNLEKPIKKMLDITPGKGVGTTKGKDGYYRGSIKAPSGRSFEITKPTSAKAKALGAKMGKKETSWAKNVMSRFPVYGDTRAARETKLQESLEKGKRS